MPGKPVDARYACGMPSPLPSVLMSTTEMAFPCGGGTVLGSLYMTYTSDLGLAA